MFKRIGLFLITNLAILIVLSVTLRLLGIDSYLAQGGGLNLNALLVFAAVFGFGGSFISLAMSKWIAKRAIGAQVIETPRNAVEQWLVETVRIAKPSRPALVCPRSPSTRRRRSMRSRPA